MQTQLLLLGVFLTSCAIATPVEQALAINSDGSYQFNFDTGKDAGHQSRHEVRNVDGSVVGRYSYQDPEGQIRVVNYRAGRQGFVATGDVGPAGAPPDTVPKQLDTPAEEIGEDAGIQELGPGGQPHEYSTTETPVRYTQTEAGTTQTAKPLVEPAVQPEVVEPVVQPEMAEPVVQPEMVEAAVQPEEDVKQDDTNRKREVGEPSFVHSPYGILPFPASPFGRRRLEIPDFHAVLAREGFGRQAASNSTEPSTTAAPTATPSSFPSSTTPAPQPAKPGNAQPVSIIYAFGSPYLPHFLPPKLVAPKAPFQQPLIEDGKGAAKYYILVPSYYQQTAEQPTVQQEQPQQHPFVLAKVAMKGFPFTPPFLPFHHFKQPQYPAQQQQSASILAYLPGNQQRVDRQQVPAEDPLTRTVSIPATNAENPHSHVLTYLQPTAVKYVPASLEPAPVQEPAKAVETPTLQRPVFHQYAFKSPNAAFGYHYQY